VFNVQVLHLKPPPTRQSDLSEKDDYTVKYGSKRSNKLFVFFTCATTDIPHEGREGGEGQEIFLFVPSSNTVGDVTWRNIFATKNCNTFSKQFLFQVLLRHGILEDQGLNFYLLPLYNSL